MPVIFVSGTHHSGAEYVTNILAQQISDSFSQALCHQAIELNDAILHHLKSSRLSLEPPKYGWEKNSLYNLLVGRIRGLVLEQGDATVVFYDTANCLTLPLWQRAVPNMKHVVVNRNPLAVAISFFKSIDANHLSFQDALQHWYSSYAAITHAATNDNATWTNYETFTLDAVDELNRLLQALGYPPSISNVKNASSSMMKTAPFERVPFQMVTHSTASPQIVQLYHYTAQLGGEYWKAYCDDNHQQLNDFIAYYQSTVSPIFLEHYELIEERDQFIQEVTIAEKKISNLTLELQDQTNKAQHLMHEVSLQKRDYEQRIQLGAANIHQLKEQLTSFEETTTSLEYELFTTRHQNNAIKQSLSWKLTKPIRLLVGAFPQGYKLLRQTAKIFYWTLTFQLISNLRTLKKHRREATIIEQSSLLNNDWYQTTYPDTTFSRLSPTWHYLRYGAQEHRNPNPFFDTAWYLQQYPDVLAANLNPLAHYIEHGVAERRNPSADFDTLWYLQQYPDAISTNLNPLAHYLQHGYKEGLRTRPYSLEDLSFRKSNITVQPNANHLKCLLTIVICDGSLRNDILASIQRQTFAGSGIEIIVWDHQHHTISDIFDPYRTAKVYNLEQLQDVVAGEYLLLTSAPQQIPISTYFEINMMALLVNGTDFTINCFDQPAFEILHHIEQGEWLPEDIFNGRIFFRNGILDTNGNLHFTPYQKIIDAYHGIIVEHQQITSQHNTNKFSWAPIPQHNRLRSNISEKIVSISLQNITFSTPSVHPDELNNLLQNADQPSAERPVVLVLFNFIAVGGAERVTFNVLEQLCDDYTFVILTVEQATAQVGSMSQLFRSITDYVYPIADYLPYEVLYDAFAYFMKRFSPSALFVPNGSNWFFDHLSRIRSDYPNITISHQVYDHEIGWIKKIHTNAIDNITFHIAPNVSIANAYRHRGIEENKIVTIYHGINPNVFDPIDFDDTKRRAIRQRYRLDKDMPVIAFIARMHPQKRPQDFVALARHFEDQEYWQFLMVGDGEEASSIDLAIQDLSNIRRIPFQDNVADLLAVIDCLVLTSEYEGLPLIALEAQAMGVPVVATNVGALQEMMDHTKGGIIIDSIGDIPAFAQTIKFVLNDYECDPNTMRNAIITHYSAAQKAQQYAKVFDL